MALDQRTGADIDEGGPIKRYLCLLLLLLAATSGILMMVRGYVVHKKQSASMDVEGWRRLASQATRCADITNRVFAIDGRFVFREIEGSCNDASYSYALYGKDPDELLCSTIDSIAGPLTECVDDSAKRFFQFICGNRNNPDLGLRNYHRVEILYEKPREPRDLSSSTLAQLDRKPSTADERALAIKAARVLESDPLSYESQSLRNWYTIWLVGISDINFITCSAYLEPVFGTCDKAYADEISQQLTFSAVAFMIQNPDQAGDRVAVNLAGVKGALKTYEAILKEYPQTRCAFLDDLVKKRHKGELKAYVEEIAKTKCAGA